MHTDPDKPAEQSVLVTRQRDGSAGDAAVGRPAERRFQIESGGEYGHSITVQKGLSERPCRETDGLRLTKVKRAALSNAVPESFLALPERSFSR